MTREASGDRPLPLPHPHPHLQLQLQLQRHAAVSKEPETPGHDGTSAAPGGYGYGDGPGFESAVSVSVLSAAAAAAAAGTATDERQHTRTSVSGSATSPTSPSSLGTPGPFTPPDPRGDQAGPDIRYPDSDPESLSPRDDVHFLSSKSALFKFVFLSTTCATQLIAQAQFGMLIVPLYEIGEWLGTGDAGEMSWMAASYGLTVGITVLISGRLGDLYGPKFVWTIGILVVIFSNLGSGFCRSPIPFDITRAISGIGAALSLPNALAILGRTYPPGRMRHVVFAILGALAPAGFWLGGAVGAIFAQLAGVRWIWWFMTIFSAVFLLVGLLVLPPDNSDEDGDGARKGRTSKSRIIEKIISATQLRPHPRENPASTDSHSHSTRPSSFPNITPTHTDITSNRPRAKFDHLGALLLIIALGLFNAVWNQSYLVSWSEPYIYSLLVVSIIAFVLFFSYEKKQGKEALVPTEVLRKQSLLVYLSLWLGWMSLGTFLLYTSLFIREIRGYRQPLTIAAQMFPLMPCGCAAALAVPYLITRYSGHTIFLAAMLSFMTGSLLAATAPAHGIYWGNTFWSLILVIAGPDLSFSTGQLIVSNSVDREFQGIAAGIVSMITNYSLSIGLGMAGTVERYVRLAAIAAGDEERDALLKGYRAAFYFAVGLSGLAVLVVALFVRMPKQEHT